MQNSFLKWFILYGTFLILAGIAGYLSNPEKAKTALMSGGTFGFLSIVLGFLGSRGLAWCRSLALVMIAFLSIIFSWRAAVSWMAVQDGQSGKLFAASLISLMLLATLAMLAAMVRKKI